MKRLLGRLTANLPGMSRQTAAPGVSQNTEPGGLPMDRSGFFDTLTKRFETDFARQLQGYRLTTAEIIYHLPDHPSLLQSYLWQEYDIAPKFPQLKGFLDFWTQNLDGPLHSVKVTAAGIVSAAEWRHVDVDTRLH